MKFIKFLIYLRECIYYESFLVEKKRGINDLVLPSLLVGLFDSPFIFCLMLLIEPLFFSESILRKFYPSNITGFFSVVWFFLVAIIELMYFRISKNDIKIIRKFESFNDQKLFRVKILAFLYALSSLFGGVLAIYYLW